MPSQPPPQHSSSVQLLMQARDGLVLHQALCAAASLGLADALSAGPRSTPELAAAVHADDSALYRLMRTLSGYGVFHETAPRSFANNALSEPLRDDHPQSIRPALLFFGSDLFYGALGDLLGSVQTGESARMRRLGMNSFEYMAAHPDIARIFDGAMTAMSRIVSPSVASAYDFGFWQSVTDVGGGSGILLAAILHAHKDLTGVLADQPHVIERARQRGLLGGELAARASFVDCDFFAAIPSGTRAYIMKSVIHDWDDASSLQILTHCRNAVPAGGALLLVEHIAPPPNTASPANVTDLIMLALTGGKERTSEEYADLLQSAGFHLDKVVPTPSGFSILQASPA